MAKQKEQQKEESQSNNLASILADNKNKHYNYAERVEWKVSTGSLLLDAATNGGISPSLIRICGANNEGKAQPLWAKVLTPHGWKKIGDLRQGCMVIGSDGKPHQVLNVFPQGIKKINKITFSDKTYTYCCDEHLWFTKDFNDRQDKKRGSVKTTNFIKKTLKRKLNYNHSIPYVKPVEFEPFKMNLPLDSYLLGLLIGDGCFAYRKNRKTTYNIGFTSADKELINNIAEILPNPLKIVKKSKKSKYDYRIHGLQIVEILQSLNLMGKLSYEKHIPKEYLFSSIENRKLLLQGLMDTDGTVYNNRNGKKCTTCEYSTTSTRLMEDVKFLVQSLGGRVAVQERFTFYTYKGEKKQGRKSYRIIISFNDFNPFKLKRKSSLFSFRKTEIEKYFTKIEPFSEEECVCIKIDSEDSLYVTDDFILTHNTPSTLEICRNFLNTVKNSKVFWVLSEGRGLTKQNTERCELKFVYSAEEWKVGTVFVLESNVYELFIKCVKDLVLNNPENVRYCFVVDSLDGMMLDADREKEIDENNKVAGSPALSKKMLQSLSLGMFKFGHLMILISQVTAEIKLDPYTKAPNRGGQFSGGNSLLHGSDFIFEFQPTFNSDIILNNSSGKLNDGRSKPIGKYAKVILQKSAIEESRKQLVQFPIKFGKKPSAVWNEYEICDLLLMWEFIKKSGAWLKFEETIIKELKDNKLELKEMHQGMDNLRIYLEENQDITQYFFNKFKAALIG